MDLLADSSAAASGQSIESPCASSNPDGTNVLEHAKQSSIDSSAHQMEISETGKAENAATEVSAPGGLVPLPSVAPNLMCGRRFEFAEANVEVTSLDVSAHGAFLLAGCGNGLILMFDMSCPCNQGVVVGQIQAKGLHTNLLLTCQFSQDSRFIFAGVIKGSSELVAVDISRVPVWGQVVNSSRDGELIPAATAAPTARMIKSLGDRRAWQVQEQRIREQLTLHRHSDPKLRGFGASARVVPKGSGDGPAHYRLVCGRGIKNMHVWTFHPDCAGDAQWHCVYDVASNGSSIQQVGFRAGGHQVLTKSAGVALRLWDISALESATVGTDPLKPSFEDVPNSQDVCALAEDFCFGGLYNFAAVRLDAPRDLNRDVLPLPERAN